MINNDKQMDHLLNLFMDKALSIQSSTGCVTVTPQVQPVLPWWQYSIPKDSPMAVYHHELELLMGYRIEHCYIYHTYIYTIHIYIFATLPSQNPCFALFSEGCLKQPWECACKSSKQKADVFFESCMQEHWGCACKSSKQKADACCSFTFT